MSRRTHKPNKSQRQAAERRKQEQAASQIVAEIRETAERFTCTSEVALTFAEQCAERLDETAYDLEQSRVALEIWAAARTSDNVKKVVELLSELAAEHERHLRTMASLGARLDEYAARDIHEHLEPIQPFAELVYRRLFLAPAEDDADDGSS
jgi:hypothetical protein